MGQLQVLGSMLLPSSCPVCGAIGPSPCGSCRRVLQPAMSGFVPSGLDRCRSLLAYEGAGRELLARLKYRNARSPLAWLALGMAGLVSRWQIDVVTWAPTSASRRRARGYDQAELLARAVAAERSLPCRALLRRLPGPPQTGRSREARRLGPAFTTRPPPNRVPDGGAVLLVDDLLTTGATLSAAAAMLRASGAGSVLAVTAGRTPLKIPSRGADP
jgi:predicted amidophosphoribosyltransferase